MWGTHVHLIEYGPCTPAPFITYHTLLYIRISVILLLLAALFSTLNSYKCGNFADWSLPMTLLCFSLMVYSQIKNLPDMNAIDLDQSFDSDDFHRVPSYIIIPSTGETAPSTNTINVLSKF
jgi:hypothetical protein